MNSTSKVYATFNVQTKTFWLADDAWLARQRVFVGNTDNHNRAKRFDSAEQARETFAKHGFSEIR